MRARENASHSELDSSRLTISWKDPSVARDQAADTVRLAAWIGLLTGYGEVVCLGAQKYFFQSPIYFGLHIIWMAPLATAGLFSLIGMLCAASALVWPKIGTSGNRFTVLIFLGILSWVLIFPQINFYAGF